MTFFEFEFRNKEMSINLSTDLTTCTDLHTHIYIHMLIKLCYIYERLFRFFPVIMITCYSSKCLSDLSFFLYKFFIVKLIFETKLYLKPVICLSIIVICIFTFVIWGSKFRDESIHLMSSEIALKIFSEVEYF